MKTASLMDNELLQEADETARAMGLNRSQEQMLRKLNEVYEHGPDEAEDSLLNGIKARFHPADEEPW